MKYAITQPPAPRPSLDTAYHAVAGEEITLIAWNLEGRTQPCAQDWREVARANGIVDPFQTVGAAGGQIAGQRLTMGLPVLPVT